jgi:hypothetical protein
MLGGILQHFIFNIGKFSLVPVARPIILATQEAEIRRITVPSQPGKIV